MAKKRIKIKKLSLKGLGYTELSSASNNSLENDINSKKVGNDSNMADIYSEIMYLNGYVDEEISKLMSDLESQYKKNIEIINRFYTQRAANKKELELLLENLNEQIPIAEEEFYFAQKIYNDRNPISIDKDNIDDTDQGEQYEKIIKNKG